MILGSVGEVFALEHARMLILSSCIILSSIKNFTNVVTLGSFSEVYVKFQFWWYGLNFLGS